MSEITRKVCMLGDFGVGKTSLVARFVNQTFSERYITTVGVKIDTKVVTLEEQSIKLVLWDVAGKNALDMMRVSYLQGAAGLILVADGTREPTVRAAMNLYTQAQKERPEIKAVMLINKFDLIDQWEVDAGAIAAIRNAMPAFESSARSGEGVEMGFAALAKSLR
jgi:hypothetical protein